MESRCGVRVLAGRRLNAQAVCLLRFLLSTLHFKWLHAYLGYLFFNPLLSTNRPYSTREAGSGLPLTVANSKRLQLTFVILVDMRTCPVISGLYPRTLTGQPHMVSRRSGPSCRRSGATRQRQQPSTEYGQRRNSALGSPRRVPSSPRPENYSAHRPVSLPLGSIHFEPLY